MICHFLRCEILFALLACSGQLAHAQKLVQDTNAPVASQVDDSTSRPRARRSYMGRPIAQTMSAAGADWLVRNTRQQQEHPRQLLAALELQPGQQVCDFGCGNGFYTLKLARLVGPHGIVYAVDIQQEMLDLLRSRCGPREIRNITTRLATTTDPKLPQRQMDLVLMVDVYHELSHPELILRSVHKSLAERGRLAIVEFRAEDPTVPIKPLHKMSVDQVMKEISASGFKLVGQNDDLPWQHVLLFARTDSPRKAIAPQPWQPVDPPIPAQPVEAIQPNTAGRREKHKK